MLKEIGVGLTLGNQKQVIMVFFQRKLVPTYISGLSVLTFIFYLMCRRKRYIEWLTSDRIDPPVLPCIQYLGLIFIFGLFFIFTLLISEMWAVSTKTQGFAFGVNFISGLAAILFNFILMGFTSRPIWYTPAFLILILLSYNLMKLYHFLQENSMK